MTGKYPKSHKGKLKISNIYCHLVKFPWTITLVKGNDPFFYIGVHWALHHTHVYSTDLNTCNVIRSQISLHEEGNTCLSDASWEPHRDTQTSTPGLFCFPRKPIVPTKIHVIDSFSLFRDCLQLQAWNIGWPSIIINKECTVVILSDFSIR